LLLFRDSAPAPALMRATISVVDTIVELPLPCGQFYGAPLFKEFTKSAGSRPARLLSVTGNA